MNICLEIVQSLLEQDCALCGSRSGNSVLCRHCEQELPRLSPCCPQCAIPSPSGARCGACLATSPHFESTLALWPYAFPVDRLVQALKYHGRLPLAEFFGQAVALQVFCGVDMIVPMPLHPGRLAERGFNQAAEIARHVARLARVPLELGAARRIRATRPQTDLPRDQRARNVRGAFQVSGDLSGKRIAVVDDVMTTGATLNELARALKRAGAVRVENWVVARTVTDV